MVFLYILALFWFLRSGKAVLFWLYLWQLKEYHIGRFIDHFRTAKGQHIFLNPLFFIKLALFCVLLLFFVLSFSPKTDYDFLPWYKNVVGLFGVFGVFGIFFIYIFEAGKSIFDAARKRIPKPVFTKKIILLFTAAAAVVAAAAAVAILLLPAFGNALPIFALGLLLLDILLPVIVSAIVLAVQPFAVLGRRRIIEKAKRKRAEFKNLTVIGITGSYGKTSTKEFLALMLGEKFCVLKTKEHQNSEVGVAQCILNDLRPEHEVFIAEMGAYGRGGIKLLCDIAKPKIGILIGINEQHMATYGSQENIIKTKFELIESLPEEGVAIVNWDNDFIKSQISNLKSQISSQTSNLKSQSCTSKLKTIKYSFLRDKEADIWAENVRVEKEYLSFRGCSKDEDYAEFRVNVLGAHFVPNILAATSVAKELGMTMAEIAEQCKKITPELAGMTMRKGINGATIIDSTYSANPDGVIAHLEYLKVWPGRKAIIMPCLIELGKASKEVHQRIGRKIGEVCDLAIITTKERFSDIKSGAIGVGMKEENILFLEKPHQIFEKVKDAVGTEDVVLLEGRLPKTLIKMFEK